MATASSLSPYGPPSIMKIIYNLQGVQKALSQKKARIVLAAEDFEGNREALSPAAGRGDPAIACGPE